MFLGGVAPRLAHGTGLTTTTAVPCAARARAVVANSGQSIHNANSLVDSYASSQGPYGGTNVGTQGDVQAATNIVVNSGATIRGTKVPNSPAGFGVISPPADATDLGVFVLNSGQSVTLNAGNYVASNFTMNSSSTLRVSGGVVSIWVSGALILGGAANPQGLPHNLEFLVTEMQDVHVNSGGALAGFIYAPMASVLVDATVFGSVVGRTVTLNSGGRVHFDRDAKCPACPSGQTFCGGACTNTQTDPSNCRLCGTFAPPGTPATREPASRPISARRLGRSGFSPRPPA